MSRTRLEFDTRKENPEWRSWDPIKRPAVVRVQTMPKGEEIVALCEKHHWKVIVGIEPTKPEDLSDIDLLRARPRWEPLAPRAAPRIGRNDYCPCGSGKKFKNCCATP